MADGGQILQIIARMELTVRPHSNWTSAETALGIGECPKTKHALPALLATRVSAATSSGEAVLVERVLTTETVKTALCSEKTLAFAAQWFRFFRWDRF